MMNDEFKLSIMNTEHVKPYAQAIANCIASCTNHRQLECCFDMIERFKQVFKPFYSPIKLHQQIGQLHEMYNAQHATIGLI